MNCKECTACDLYLHRKQVVLGRGQCINPSVLIVGEAPGANEDETGVPFIGASGHMLSNIISCVGWDDDDSYGNTYITNAVKCRPPQNKTPNKKQIQACYPWLEKEIETLKPKVILTLGNVPLKSLGFENKVSKLVGKNKTLVYKDIPVVAAYHPAYLLRNPSLSKGSPKWLTLMSLLKIRRILKNGM